MNIRREKIKYVSIIIFAALVCGIIIELCSAG